jgi:hypothetical protein
MNARTRIALGPATASLLVFTLVRTGYLQRIATFAGCAPSDRAVHPAEGGGLVSEERAIGIATQFVTRSRAWEGELSEYDIIVRAQPVEVLFRPRNPATIGGVYIVTIDAATGAVRGLEVVK